MAVSILDHVMCRMISSDFCSKTTREGVYYIYTQHTVVGEEETGDVEEVASQLLEWDTIVVLLAEETIDLVDGDVVLLLEGADVAAVHLVLEALDDAVAPFVVGGVAILAVHDLVGAVVAVEEAHLAITGWVAGLVVGVQVRDLLEAR